MQLNYIKLLLNVKLFIVFLKRSKKAQFVIYNLIFKLAYLFFGFNNSCKIVSNFFLKLNLKNLTTFGLIRDVLTLNLFCYKFSSFWNKIYVGQIFINYKLKLTLLRSVFVDKNARNQYALKNYFCNYHVFLQNVWFLFYFLFLLKNKKLVIYSKLIINYTFFLIKN